MVGERTTYTITNDDIEKLFKNFQFLFIIFFFLLQKCYFLKGHDSENKFDFPNSFKVTSLWNYFHNRVTLKKSGYLEKNNNHNLKSQVTLNKNWSFILAERVWGTFSAKPIFLES